MEGIQGITGILVGFTIFRTLSLPGSKLNEKLPQIKFKIIELFPRFKINLKNRILHFHHWIVLTLVFTFLLTLTNFSQLFLVKSLCLGGIIQGFTYKDRFKIILKQS